jgi:gamma-glutamylputrescine oxidase
MSHACVITFICTTWYVKRSKIILFFILEDKYRKNVLYFHPMNISIKDLSYWERKMLIDSIDFLVVGAGIVGISCAYHLKIKYPKAKIMIIDKGLLPLSASSKNAGFACFGSPSEIISDLKTMNSESVWETVKKRWDGLTALSNWLGNETIALETNGSWDLTQTREKSTEIRDNITALNIELEKVIGIKNVYSEDKESLSKFGFERLDSMFKNKLEGQLDTAKLNLALIKKAAEKDIVILRGIEVHNYVSEANSVKLDTNIGQLTCSNLILCTNGFTSDITTDLQVEPARAQVLITNEIKNLKVRGTFHFDEGYFYFRNIDGRLLIGGGRNHNFSQENTNTIETTLDIQSVIEDVLKKIILPKTDYKIEHRWAGIMGVGKGKSPIIKRLDSRVCAGVRMGGMGIAIGTLVGQELVQLHS